MFNYTDYRILLACGATDMRKSVNGLTDIVCSQFNLEPRDKIIFAFCNNSRNRIKLLVWADNGFWIHFKRLERGKVVWPEANSDSSTMILAYDDLKNLILAPGITQKIKRTEVWKKF